MKKRVLLTVAIVGTLTTGAFAYNQDCLRGNYPAMMNQQGMQSGINQSKKHGWQGHKMRKKGIMLSSNSNMPMMGARYGGMMPILATLNLSDEQRYQLSILRDEMRLEMKKLRGLPQQGRVLKFVKDGKFDKSAFKKEMNQKHQKMLDIKANHMEKVFKLLTKEQVSELKKKFTK